MSNQPLTLEDITGAFAVGDLVLRSRKFDLEYPVLTERVFAAARAHLEAQPLLQWAYSQLDPFEYEGSKLHPEFGRLTKFLEELVPAPSSTVEPGPCPSCGAGIGELHKLHCQRRVALTASSPAEPAKHQGGYDAGVKCLRCGAKPPEPHDETCPRYIKPSPAAGLVERARRLVDQEDASDIVLYDMVETLADALEAKDAELEIWAKQVNDELDCNRHLQSKIEAQAAEIENLRYYLKILLHAEKTENHLSPKLRLEAAVLANGGAG